MSTIHSDYESIRFAKVRADFERWRQERTSRREPIPNALWTKAASLCNRYSVSQVAKALRLNATRLKERVEETHETAEVVETTPEFVELRVESYADLLAQDEAPSTVVEMSNRCGQRMTIRLSNADADTVMALASQFLGQI